MCWRDDIVTDRWCSVCGQHYFGDLGHHGCPRWLKRKKEESSKKKTVKKKVARLKCLDGKTPCAPNRIPTGSCEFCGG